MDARRNETEENLASWAEECQANAARLADMLGVPAADYRADPLAALPAWENYVSRLPLADFEESDRVTLHTDLVSFLADFMVRAKGAHWEATPDASAPGGHRYVLTAMGLDGRVRHCDPFAVVQQVSRELPLDPTRVLATAELALGLSRPERDAAH
ncbi:hypothetical protein ABZ820_08090 [Streptomyces diacarni]|uniref:hypothetical protein n=1 Tax=Streptomyces diacarni TaxID=2800381 RepID=UPI0033EB75E0